MEAPGPPGCAREGDGDPGQEPLPRTMAEALHSANHIGAFTVLSGPIEEEVAFGPQPDEPYVWEVRTVHRYTVRFDGELDESWRAVAPAWAPTDANWGGLASVGDVTEILVIGGATQFVDDRGAPLEWDDPNEACDHPTLTLQHARPPEDDVLQAGRQVALFLHQLADLNGKWCVPTRLRWRVDGAFAIERGPPPAAPRVVSGTESFTFDELRTRARSAFSENWARMLETYRSVDFSDWAAPPQFVGALPGTDER